MKTVVASFDTLAAASKAATKLMAAGFMQSDINIVSNNTAFSGASVNPDARPVDNDDGVATGALAGGALGVAAGVTISLMGLAIPGIGPILAAGTLATALAGAGAGAVAGGLIGALTDIGVPDDDAHFYAESVRRGGAVVTVRTDESRTTLAESILEAEGAIDIDERVERWRRDGWKGFDSDASPYSYDDLERERARYRTPQVPRQGM
ncbi:MAG: hypothetical protein ABI777_04675 [Betaproteobacteria bacterium]